MAELLLEIGFEEMPAPWLPGLAEQLRARFLEAAGREFLEAKGARVLYTPRRLVLRADVPARQPDREEPVWGPAAQGREGRGGEVDGRRAGLREEERGRRRCPRRGRQGPGQAGRAPPAPRRGRWPGGPTAEVLPGLLAGVLRALLFPKRMSWDAWLDDGRGAFPFGRPIRWLVLLLDGAVVPFAIHAAEGGAKGPVVVESGRPLADTASCRRARAEGSRSFVRRAERALARAVRDPATRGARRPDRSGLGAGAAASLGEPRACARSGATWSSTRPSWSARFPRSSARCRPRCSRRSSSTTRRRSRCATPAGASRASPPSRTATGPPPSEIVRGMERVVVARLRDAAFFLAEDRKRAARRAASTTWPG